MQKSVSFFIFLFHFIYCLFYHLMIFCKNNENRLNTDYYKRIIQNVFIVYNHIKYLNGLHCSTKALCIAQKTYFFMQYRVFIE